MTYENHPLVIAMQSAENAWLDARDAERAYCQQWNWKFPRKCAKTHLDALLVERNRTYDACARAFPNVFGYA